MITTSALSSGIVELLTTQRCCSSSELSEDVEGLAGDEFLVCGEFATVVGQLRGGDIECGTGGVVICVGDVGLKVPERRRGSTVVSSGSSRSLSPSKSVSKSESRLLGEAPEKPPRS